MTQPAEPSSDPRLFFLLQQAAHRLRTAADRRCLAAAGVTTAQLGALFAVHDEPGLTQQRLARVLGLRESAVTGLVARLGKAGLLVKRAHPREHRAVVLELTEDGVAALDAARPEIDRFNGELRALLGEQGFTRTAAALHRLAQWEG
ncbi:MarR family winged helix-turn-helix transcriptional regulator [Streptomyces sp. NPDC003362]